MTPKNEQLVDLLAFISAHGWSMYSGLRHPAQRMELGRIMLAYGIKGEEGATYEEQKEIIRKKLRKAGYR